MKWLKALLALVRGFLKRLRTAKEAGRIETIVEAHREADYRVREAQAIRDEWDGYSADERERVRLEHGHYRD